MAAAITVRIRSKFDCIPIERTMATTPTSSKVGYSAHQSDDARMITLCILRDRIAVIASHTRMYSNLRAYGAFFSIAFSLVTASIGRILAVIRPWFNRNPTAIWPRFDQNPVATRS